MPKTTRRKAEDIKPAQFIAGLLNNKNPKNEALKNSLVRDRQPVDFSSSEEGPLRLTKIKSLCELKFKRIEIGDGPEEKVYYAAIGVMSKETNYKQVTSALQVQNKIFNDKDTRLQLYSSKKLDNNQILFVFNAPADEQLDELFIKIANGHRIQFKPTTLAKEAHVKIIEERLAKAKAAASTASSSAAAPAAAASAASAPPASPDPMVTRLRRLIESPDRKMPPSATESAEINSLAAKLAQEAPISPAAAAAHQLPPCSLFGTKLPPPGHGKPNTPPGRRNPR